METFLDIVSKDIINKYGNKLSNIAIVFPNKRASLFMSEAIAKANKGKALWSPAYITISELFREQTDLNTIDDIAAICKLHKAYLNATGEKETLDHFFGWGKIMLSDFDDIDKNLGDAEKIFNLLNNYSSVEKMEYLTDEQKEILKKFYNKDGEQTEAHKRFINLWNKLGKIYKEFNYELLNSEDKATYEGALYRSVAESKEPLKLNKDVYLFIGFNMLQKAEQKLFDKIKDAGKARFYWDYDEYYKNKEAGTFISQYLDKYPNEIKDKNVFNCLNSTEKQISYISASTNDMQARYIKEWMTDDKIKAGKRTAIVLCDENLISSVLHSIPKNAEPLNITMGVPLKDTQAARLAVKLIELTRNIKDNSPIFIKLLRPILFDTLATDLGINKTYNQLIEEKNYKQKLSEIGLPELNGYDTKSKNKWVNGLIKTAAKNYAEKHNNGDDNINTLTTENALTIESLFKVHTLLNRLEGLMEEGLLNIDENTYSNLVKCLMETESIPFHGEPAKGIQVMGVLETRNMDFDNILLLSTNEGNMPKTASNISFIPQTIRHAYELTTIDKKDSIYAYYFYNLIQRAKNITLTYSTVSEIGQKGEMSRFMQQLSVESGIDIKHFSMQKKEEYDEEQKNISDKIAQSQKAKLEINKNDETIETLKKRFKPTVYNDEPKLMSPSAINTYISCPMKFYYQYVIGLSNGSDPDIDEIDAARYGTIFHDTMKELYDGICGKDLSEEDFNFTEDEIKNTVKKKYEEVVLGTTQNIPEINGANSLEIETIVDYVRKMINIDKQTAINHEFKILELEKKYWKELNIDIIDNYKIALGGIIDRIDEIDGTIRIVDYKTGTKKSGVNEIEDMFDVSSEKQKGNRGYYLQTFLYSVIVKDKDFAKGNKVVPALIYIPSIKEDENPTLTLVQEETGKAAVIDDINTDLKNKYEELLKQTLNDIFDKNKPFCATYDNNQCIYCNFSELCNHNNINSENSSSTGNEPN